MEPSSEKQDAQKLVQTILEDGNKAFNPDSSPHSRVEAERTFNDLIRR